MSKQAYVTTLLQLFRQFGYEGLTLSKISQATGLGKASLYHHFPGGKAEMAEAALEQVNQWLETIIVPMLEGEGAPIAKFQAMCEQVNHFFCEGQNSCPLAVLALEQASNDLFHTQIRQVFSRWIAAIAQVLITAGLAETLAKQRGEDAMIAIQGASILSQALKEIAPFQRVIQQLPQQLCRDL